MERAVGFFANLIALRTDQGENPSLARFLVQVNDAVTEALAHADLPYECVVEDWVPTRTVLGRTPVNVMMVFQNAPFGILEIPGVTISPEDVFNGTAKYDANPSVVDRVGSPRGILRTRGRPVRQWLDEQNA